jgi:hypothetical protein
MPDLLPSDILTDICGFCGIAIYPNEVAAEFGGTLVDYANKTTATGGFVLCGECWQRVKIALEGDIETAVEKRNRIFSSSIGDGT